MAASSSASVGPAYRDDYVFIKFKGKAMESRYLYCMNCGPDAGMSYDFIRDMFSKFGPLENIFPAGDNGTRVFVVFENISDAAAAKIALDQIPCDMAGGKVMRIDFSDIKEKHKETYMPVMMNAEEVGVPGLTFYPEFVSIEEEEELLAAVDSEQWDELTKRRVQHYGYAFNYKTRSVDPDDRLGDLPSFTKRTVSRIEALPELQFKVDPCLPLDQLTVNEYLRGVGLSPHVDIHSAFEGCVVSLSLGSSCIMQFRRPKSYPPSQEDTVNGMDVEASPGDDENDDRFERKALFLPQRSLLVLCGEARYSWSHYIPHHRLDMINGEKVQRGRRVSFTFRKIRRSPCNCLFPEECDDRKKRAAKEPSTEASKRETMAEISQAEPAEVENPTEKAVEQSRKGWGPPEIEKTYVHKVYDAIAPHFSSTRFAKWPKVSSFLHSLSPGSLVLDAGCGNGKYLGLNPACTFLGCDISSSLAGICGKAGSEVAVADVLSLPYRDCGFDAGISIAVLHHLSSDERRKRAMAELLRVVKVGGFVLFTVWAREQEDTKLVAKWTPLIGAHTEGWVDFPEGGRGKPNSGLGLVEEEGGEDGRQQEYFVPWHLPYHRAEVSGASATAVAAGLARKDDVKGAVVYDRYYHVFNEGEIEGLAGEVGGCEVVDRFYDKSNWCIALRKL